LVLSFVRVRNPAVVAAGLLACAACARSPADFDESAAWAHLVKQVELGPRVSASPAHARALEYFRAHFNATADRVAVDSFEAVCALNSSDVVFTNIRASFRPDSPRRILFGAHWDSRPFADRDPDPARRRDPVPGANDGASGVAVLLEVASRLKDAPPEVGVDLLLFDGEDCGADGLPETYALGSQHFVRSNPRYRPEYAVILDMVGRREMRLPKEGNSAEAAAELTATIWRIAAEIGSTAFVDSVGDAVWDDHVAFLQVGIPAVDIIDIEDPFWHTVRDTPEHCSAESLGQVGRVVLELIRQAEKIRAY
jgi:hypothetical protein